MEGGVHAVGPDGFAPISSAEIEHPLYKMCTYGTLGITGWELRVTELKGDAAKAGPVDVIQLRFRGQKLDKKDIIGKSDPFLEFCRRTTDGKWETVLRSEVVKNNQNPTWPMLKIKAHQLSGGDYSNPIKVFCKDWDAVGTPDLIGCFMTSVSELIRNSKGIEWPCINEAKKSKKNYTNSGVIILVSCEVVKE